MADLAIVFHWPPAAMYPMTLDEILTWHEEARIRHRSED